MIDLTGIDTFAELEKARSEIYEEIKNQGGFPAREAFIERQTDYTLKEFTLEKRDIEKLVYDRFYENIKNKKQEECV